MASKSHGAEKAGEAQSVFSISPLMIIPSTTGPFTVYLRQGDQLVLYSSKGESFTREHREKLAEMGIRRIFLRSEDKSSYETYIRENLGALLADDSIPLEERSQAWYEASITLVRNVFTQRLPKTLTRRRYEKVQELVRASVQFLSDPAALKAVARFIAKGFKVYDHSIGVMVLYSCVLQTFDWANEDLLLKCCLGALLHDLGRTQVPQDILEKREENLSAGELELLRAHPVMGVAMCSSMPLSQETINCILFHHEKENGQGYPAGITSDNVPRYVKALVVCNAYDRLTRTAVHRPAKSPFEALNRIKTEKDAYDLESIKRLIMVLANAEIA